MPLKRELGQSSCWLWIVREDKNVPERRSERFNYGQASEDTRL